MRKLIVSLALFILEPRRLGQISRRPVEGKPGVEHSCSQEGMVRGATGMGAVRRYSVRGLARAERQCSTCVPSRGEHGVDWPWLESRLSHAHWPTMRKS